MFNIKKKLQKYFKLITYNIYKLIYGDIKGKIRNVDNDDIILKKHSIDNIFYDVYSCKDCSLYTDRIHDTAIIKEKKIVDGPSFQLRNNLNVDCLENFVLENGTPRKRKHINGNVLSLLTGGGGNTNYWHWLFDVLPRIKLFMTSSFSKETIDFYLLPSKCTDFQKETLKLLNIDKNKMLPSEKFRHIFAKKIFITSHPYNLLNNPELDSLNIPLWISDYLRSSFLKISLMNSKIKKLPKKIYINRKDGTSFRYITNEIEVENYLQQKGFKSLTLSDLSFSDQVNLFHNAEKIIGLHGAGFANIIFCKPNTKIIEIRNQTAGDLFKNLAIKNNLNYDDLTLKTKKYDFNNQAGDIEVDLNILKNLF